MCACAVANQAFGFSHAHDRLVFHNVCVENLCVEGIIFQRFAKNVFRILHFAATDSNQRAALVVHLFRECPVVFVDFVIDRIVARFCAQFQSVGDGHKASAAIVGNSLNHIVAVDVRRHTCDFAVFVDCGICAGWLFGDFPLHRHSRGELVFGVGRANACICAKSQVALVCGLGWVGDESVEGFRATQIQFKSGKECDANVREIFLSSNGGELHIAANQLQRQHTAIDHFFLNSRLHIFIIRFAPLGFFLPFTLVQFNGGCCAHRQFQKRCRRYFEAHGRASLERHTLVGVGTINYGTHTAVERGADTNHTPSHAIGQVVVDKVATSPVTPCCGKVKTRFALCLRLALVERERQTAFSFSVVPH